MAAYNCDPDDLPNFTPDDDDPYWEQQAQTDAEVEAHERELAEREERAYALNAPWGEQQAQVDWLESRYDDAYGYDD